MNRGFRPVMQLRLTVDDDKLLNKLVQLTGLNKSAVIRLALRDLQRRLQAPERA